MQADAARSTPRYKGFGDAVRTIYHESGWKAFYRGLGPSMGRAGFSVAATLGTYDHCKYLLLRQTWTHKQGIDSKDFRLHVLCSLCSGFFATLLACPFDVVKTRYQSQSFINPLYSSGTMCLKQIVKNDGITVLFRGFAPMYARYATSSLAYDCCKIDKMHCGSLSLRLGPWQITFFVTFEWLHKRILNGSF